MKTILRFINGWFLEKRYFESFAEKDSRVEGWLKAELIILFEGLQKRGIIKYFRIESKVNQIKGRKRVDFELHTKNMKHLCELKALCISQTKTNRNLKFYFRKNKLGLINDFRKLNVLTKKNKYKKWVLGFVYPKPTLQEWEDAVKSLPKTFESWKCETKLKNYPSFLFISLWKSRN